MPRTVVSPDYQVVIPEEVRREVPIERGQTLQVTAKGGVITLVPEPSLESLRGLLKGVKIEGFREKEDRF